MAINFPQHFSHVIRRRATGRLENRKRLPSKGGSASARVYLRETSARGQRCGNVDAADAAASPTVDQGGMWPEREND